MELVLKYVIWNLICVGSVIVGALGFPAIMGSIKYPWTVDSPAKTISFWVVVLLVVAIVAHLLPSSYVSALYAGYAFSFVKSWWVTPGWNDKSEK